MKNLFILLIAVCWCQNTLSAQGYTIIYEAVQQGGVEVVGTTSPAELKRANASKNIQSYQLKHKNGISNYVWLPSFKNEKTNTALSLKDGGVTEVRHVHAGADEPSILCKYLAKKKYTKRDTGLGKPVMIKDELPQYKWELIEETKVVGSYVCKKATAKQGKDIITAWYAVSVPVKDGPDKYYGLPGLIIELKHDYMTYRAVSVKGTPDVEIIIPNEKKVMSQAEYDKKFDEIFESFMKGSDKR